MRLLIGDLTSFLEEVVLSIGDLIITSLNGLDGTWVTPPIIALVLVIPVIILSAANIYLMVRGDSDD